jgi:hypothetical protein
MVALESGHSMECIRWITKLNITLGNYNLTYYFYVVNVVNKSVAMGVQWLFSIGKYSMNYQTMEMEL